MVRTRHGNDADQRGHHQTQNGHQTQGNRQGQFCGEQPDITAPAASIAPTDPAGAPSSATPSDASDRPSVLLIPGMYGVHEANNTPWQKKTMLHGESSAPYRRRRAVAGARDDLLSRRHNTPHVSCRKTSQG